MFTELKDFPFDRAKATMTSQIRHTYMLECIKRAEESESTDSHRERILDIIWSEVGFIGALSSDLKRVHTNVLKKRFNMMKTVIKHISGLTYKEYLHLFPIPIYFDGNCCSLCSDVMESFVGAAYEKLGECGIDIDRTDMDDVIGDNEHFHDLISSNEHPALQAFQLTLYATFDLLMKRDKSLRDRHEYSKLMYSPDVFV